MKSDMAEHKALTMLGNLRGLYKSLDQVHDLPRLERIVDRMGDVFGFYCRELAFLKALDRNRRDEGLPPIEIDWTMVETRHDP